MLVRPDVKAAVLATMQDFENATGHKTAVPDRGGFRTADIQQAIYADSVASGFRAGTPGSSFHEYGAAIDLVIVGMPQNAERDQQSALYRRLAEIGRSHGLRPGFFWTTGKPDPYHFEANEPLDTAKARWAQMKQSSTFTAGVVAALILIFGGLAYVSHK